MRGFNQRRWLGTSESQEGRHDGSCRSGHLPWKLMGAWALAFSSSTGIIFFFLPYCTGRLVFGEGQGVAYWCMS